MSRKKQTILYVLIVLNVLFIWCNSMLPAETSNAISDPIISRLDRAISEKEEPVVEAQTKPSETEPPKTTESEKQETENPVQKEKKHETVSLFFFKIRTHRFVRKSAHILEYILLGLWCALLLLRDGIRPARYKFLALTGLFVPLIDETIQFWSGRTSLVGDIWLDLLSFSVGVFVVTAGSYLSNRKNRKHTEKKPGRRPYEFSLKKELAAGVCLLAALVLLCGAALPVLTPKRHDYGSVWGMYEKEPKNSVDVLVLGSSLAYCDIVPAVLYEKTGLTSFVMAGPEQTFPVTYRYLKQALKTQSPRFVMVEATGLLFGKTNRSVKVNLTYMPYNLDRLSATMTETAGSERAGLLFPMYAYHDRWDELTAEDLRKGVLGYDTDPMAGYTFLDEITVIDGFSPRDLPDEPDTYLENLSFVEKIRDLCAEKGIRLYFFLSPYASRPEDGDRAKIMKDVTDRGIMFKDFNGSFDSFGFDLKTDFYDPAHLNYRGAVKFTEYLADRLKANITPSGKADAALWKKRVSRFSELRAAADAAPPRYKQTTDNNG